MLRGREARGGVFRSVSVLPCGVQSPSLSGTPTPVIPTNSPADEHDTTVAVCSAVRWPSAMVPAVHGSFKVRKFFET